MRIRTSTILASLTSALVTTFVWSVVTISRNLMPVTIDLKNLNKVLLSFETLGNEKIETNQEIHDGSRFAGKFFDYSESKKEQILEYLVVKDFGVAFDVSTKLYYTQQLIESFLNH